MVNLFWREFHRKIRGPSALTKVTQLEDNFYMLCEIKIRHGACKQQYGQIAALVNKI